MIRRHQRNVAIGVPLAAQAHDAGRGEALGMGGDAEAVARRHRLPGAEIGQAEGVLEDEPGLAGKIRFRQDEVLVVADGRRVEAFEEVLQLIADGLSTPEVASSLYISQKTVKNHLAAIYQKLDARDRTQAVVRAVRMGIIRLD